MCKHFCTICDSTFLVREKSLKNDCNFFFMNSGNIKCKMRSGHVSLYDELWVEAQEWSYGECIFSY